MADAVIGSAYLQVIPKMELNPLKKASSAAGQVAGDAFGKPFDGTGSKITKALGGAFKAASAAAAATSATVGVVAKQAFTAYADYEQLAGGIQKLFGDASGAVMENAQKAYQTAGMSANQYMEQASGFAAALTSSLGGDVTKAAEQADVAMRSMSDNVNTFGSSMGDVQNAYQGFAKQNYTMLDNLKLGYGGTKEEMERLIADANEWGAANGQASDLSIDSFSDVVTAIDQIQQKQKIAGTTAKEAGTTIEGSMNAAKGAWSNLLAEVGKTDGDVGARVEELVTSLIGDGTEGNLGVLGNVAPRIATIIGNVVQQLPRVISSVAPTVAQAVADMLDSLTNGGFSQMVETIRPYAERIGAAMGDLMERMQPLIPVVQDIGDKLGGILLTALDAATAAFEWLEPIVATIAENALPVLATVLGTVGDAFEAALTLMEPVGTFLGETLSDAIDWIGDKLQQLADWVDEHFGAIGDAAASVAGFLEDPIGGIGDLATKAGDAIFGTADSADKAAGTAKKAGRKFDTFGKDIDRSMKGASRSASDNMGRMSKSVAREAQAAAKSSETNSARIKKSWDKSYTTKMNAKANTSKAESTMSGFKSRWSNFSVSGRASVETSTAYTNLQKLVDSFQGKVISMKASISKTFGLATGGVIVRRHADGFIANRPGTGVDITRHIVGEAGAEAVIPLTNRRYVAPFAKTVADFVGDDLKNGGTYNISLNNVTVNDTPAMRAATKAYLMELARLGAI